MTVGTWTAGPALPVGIADAAYVSASDAQGRVYVLGGSLNGDAVNLCYRFDPATNSWSTIPSMPGRLKAAEGATDDQGRIYVLGGYAYGISEPRDTVYRFDPATNSWSTLPSMPTFRAGHTVAADGQGRIYVMGGQTYSSPDQDNSFQATVFRFDPTANAWSTVASLPAVRNGGAGATDQQGRVYLIGGASPTNPTSSTFRFDPVAGTWSTMASAPVGLGSGSTAATDIGNLIYVFGGHADPYNAIRYNPVGNYWQTNLTQIPSTYYASVWSGTASVDAQNRMALITAKQGSAPTALLLGRFNTPPNAPILTSMTGGAFVPFDVTNRASHQFSDADPGDSQSSFFLRYRSVGASSWTTLAEQITPNQYYDFPSDTFTLGNYERQVATRDSIGTPASTSDLVWSSSGFFSVGTTPVGPTFTDPTNGQSLFLATYTAVISVPDATQTEWRTVADDGSGNPDTSIIYSASVVKTVEPLRSFTFKFPVNNRTEHLEVRAFFEGLWSPWTDSTNPIAYTQPPAPTVVVTEDPTNGRLIVMITNPPPDPGQPAVAYNDIRADDLDGNGLDYKFGSRMVTANGTWIYWLPRAGVNTIIEVSAVGVNGTRTATTLVVSVPMHDYYYGGAYS